MAAILKFLTLKTVFLLSYSLAPQFIEILWTEKISCTEGLLLDILI